VSVATPIIDGLLCGECGYDLRSLPLDSNCPECGRRIADSIAALPVTRWLPTFRRGVTFLALALFIFTLGVEGWIYRQRTSDWDFVHKINSDAAIALFYALLLFPAAWWMSAPAPFLRRRLARPRRLVIALLIAQLLMVAMEQWFINEHWPFSYYWAAVFLLSAYALAPLLHALQLWLLLELLVSSRKILPRPLPRVLVRLVQWCFLYTVLAYAIVNLVSGFNRINYIIKPIAPGGNYIPALVRAPLLALLEPLRYVGYPIALACVIMVLHFRFRMHGPIGLTPKVSQPS
jgi:hypothetical protein